MEYEDQYEDLMYEDLCMKILCTEDLSMKSPQKTKNRTTI